LCGFRADSGDSFGAEGVGELRSRLDIVRESE
jgi:hypothetical protein